MWSALKKKLMQSAVESSLISSYIFYLKSIFVKQMHSWKFLIKSGAFMYT